MCRNSRRQWVIRLFLLCCQIALPTIKCQNVCSSVVSLLVIVLYSKD